MLAMACSCVCVLVCICIMGVCMCTYMYVRVMFESELDDKNSFHLPSKIFHDLAKPYV